MTLSVYVSINITLINYDLFDLLINIHLTLKRVRERDTIITSRLIPADGFIS
jgi:hypothetical protein